MASIHVWSTSSPVPAMEIVGNIDMRRSSCLSGDGRREDRELRAQGVRDRLVLEIRLRLEGELGGQAHVVAVRARCEALGGDGGARGAAVGDGVGERLLEGHDLSLEARRVLVRDVVRDDLLALLDRVQREVEYVDRLDRVSHRSPCLFGLESRPWPTLRAIPAPPQLLTTRSSRILPNRRGRCRCT